MKNFIKGCSVVIGLILSIGVTGAGYATTSTGTLDVSADILGACTVNGGALAFGTISAPTTDLDVDGSFSVKCTNGTNYVMALSAGGSGTYTTRTMSDGTHTLNYQIFENSARTSVWGDGTTGGTVTRSATGTGVADSQTVYGRLLTNPTAFLGGYSDAITITVTY